METLHLEKVKELKFREQYALEKLKSRETDVEKAAYENLQKTLKDEELF